MFCSRCGTRIGDESRFCNQCGQRQPGAGPVTAAEAQKARKRPSDAAQVAKRIAETVAAVAGAVVIATAAAVWKFSEVLARQGWRAGQQAAHRAKPTAAAAAARAQELAREARRKGKEAAERAAAFTQSAASGVEAFARDFANRIREENQGAQASLFCSSCGQPRLADHRFCRYCGAAQNVSTAAASPAPTFTEADMRLGEQQQR